MSATTLALAAAIHIVTATSFLFVGRAVRRMPKDGTHGAVDALALWWWGLAGYLYMEAVLDIATVMSGQDLQLWLASRVVTVPLLCGGAGCLTYYMLYLFTGRKGWRWPVAITYTATAAIFYAALYWPPPTELVVSDWLIQSGPNGNADLYRIVYFLVGIPPIASSIALLAIAHRLEPPQAYRAALVGIAILAYVGGGLVAFLGYNAVFKFAMLTGMGLIASLCVLFAYYPPRAVREKMGLPVTPRPAPSRKERQERFAMRSKELV